MADAPKIIKSHSGIGQDKFPKGLLGIRGEQEISVRSDWAGMVSSVLGSHEVCGGGGKSKINVPAPRLWRVKEGSRQCEVLSCSLWVVLTLLETGSPELTCSHKFVPLPDIYPLPPPCAVRYSLRSVSED